MKYKENGDHVYVIYYILNLLEHIQDEEDYNDALEAMSVLWAKKLSEECCVDDNDSFDG